MKKQPRLSPPIFFNNCRVQTGRSAWLDMIQSQRLVFHSWQTLCWNLICTLSVCKALHCNLVWLWSVCKGWHWNLVWLSSVCKAWHWNLVWLWSVCKAWHWNLVWLSSVCKAWHWNLVWLSSVCKGWHWNLVWLSSVCKGWHWNLVWLSSVCKAWHWNLVWLSSVCKAWHWNLVWLSSVCKAWHWNLVWLSSVCKAWHWNLVWLSSVCMISHVGDGSFIEMNETYGGVTVGMREPEIPDMAGWRLSSWRFYQSEQLCLMSGDQFCLDGFFFLSILLSWCSFHLFVFTFVDGERNGQGSDLSDHQSDGKEAGLERYQLSGELWTFHEK